MKVSKYFPIFIVGFFLIFLSSFSPDGVAAAEEVVNSPISLGTSCSNLGDLGGIASCGFQLIQILAYLLISVAFLYTIYGAVRFIGADGTERSEWRGVIVRGLIALVIMFAIWGIVRILTFMFFGTPPKTINNVPSLDSLISQ